MILEDWRSMQSHLRIHRRIRQRDSFQGCIWRIRLEDLFRGLAWRISWITAAEGGAERGAPPDRKCLKETGRLMSSSSPSSRTSSLPWHTLILRFRLSPNVPAGSLLASRRRRRHAAARQNWAGRSRQTFQSRVIDDVADGAIGWRLDPGAGLVPWPSTGQYSMRWVEGVRPFKGVGWRAWADAPLEVDKGSTRPGDERVSVYRLKQKTEGVKGPSIYYLHNEDVSDLGKSG